MPYGSAEFPDGVNSGAASMTSSNVAPWPLALCTRIAPWWASVMACTIGRPSPNPPASRLRYGSAWGETAEAAVQVGRRDAAAGVGHGDDGVPVVEADADFDAVARFGVRDGDARWDLSSSATPRRWRWTRQRAAPGRLRQRQCGGAAARPAARPHRRHRVPAPHRAVFRPVLAVGDPGISFC